jgi:hypothetical protein
MKYETEILQPQYLGAIPMLTLSFSEALEENNLSITCEGKQPSSSNIMYAALINREI